MIDKDNHMKICHLFNEVLNDLEEQYRGANFERGYFKTVKGRGIDERQKQYIHNYRIKLNDLLKEV